MRKENDGEDAGGAYIEELKLSSSTHEIEIDIKVGVHLILDLPEDVGVVANLPEMDDNVAQTLHGRLFGRVGALGEERAVERKRRNSEKNEERGKIKRNTPGS